MYKFTTFILLSTLLSCSSGFGSKLSSKNLDIYFKTKNEQDMADSLGLFWTKNNLVGNRKQSIKLSETKEHFEIYLVQSQEFENEPLTIFEKQLMIELKQLLNDSVFKTKPAELIISSDEFKPLYRIN